MSTGYESNYPTTGYGSDAQLRNEFQKIQEALGDALSRSGANNSDSLPNSMHVDLDMDSNNILNVNSLDAQSVSIDGESIYDTIDNISKGYADAAEQSALEAAQDASRAEQEADRAQREADRVEQEFRTFVASSGYQFAGDYAAGIEITQYNQIIRDSNGEFWRVSGQVDLPYTTTGAGIPEDDALVPAGDAVLRQDLADPVSGSSLVAGGVVAKVSSVNQVKSTPYPVGSVFYLSSGKRSGEFEVVAGDYSVQLAADPANALFIPVQGDMLGESKIAMRRGVEDYASTDWFGIDGDGVTDDSVLAQVAVDTCLSLGLNLQFSKPDNYYLFDNYVQVVGASEFTIRLDPKKSVFRTNGDFEGIEIYPFIAGQARQVAKHRCFFAIIDSSGVTVDGGQYICGNGETAGFQHVPESGNAASAILVLRSTDTVVKNTRIYDLLPDGVSGLPTDAGYEYRYTAILGVMTTGFSAIGNYIDGVAYSGIETRIGCIDTKVINNYVRNAGEHLTQCTPNYAQIPLSAFGADGFNRGVLVSGNTGIGERTDITVHSEGTNVIGNILIDVTRDKTISIRENAKGGVVTGNTLICTGDPGDAAFTISARNTQFEIYGNTVINYQKAFHRSASNIDGFLMGINTYIDVTDSPRYATILGRSAALGAATVNSESVYIGFESGLNSDGAGQTGLGFRSGQNAHGNSGTYIGRYAGMGSEGEHNTVVGAFAGRESEGEHNTVVGALAGQNLTGVRNTVVGVMAGRNSSGDSNVFVGSEAGDGNTGSRNAFFGRVWNNPYSNCVAFFDNAPTDDSQVNIGDRHFEMTRLPGSPDAPSEDRVRVYVRRAPDGITRLSARFPNGNIVDIATDE